ncbi:hypothetical protein OO010_00510 [Flavobacteriaceae bacterium KMM 6898]|nr:hypothetical protein [Flavobacteriaceae bacterium KMM 6898]
MKIKLPLLIVLMLLSISAYKIGDTIIARLNMQAEYAQDMIALNFIGRTDTKPMFDGVGKTFILPHVNRGVLQTIITGDKLAAAKDLCDYTKKYINSEEFITKYVKLKEGAMPLKDEHEDGGRSLSNLKEENAVFDLNIKNYPNDASYVAEQKKMKAANLKRIDNLLIASKNSFPDKELWEKTYPENPEVFVKKRLEEYLALVATVDFDAKLTEADKYNIQKFVNPVYEKKNEKWKACYRAGKEVNGVFSAFAKEWLKGELITTNKTTMGVATEKNSETNLKASESSITSNETGLQNSQTNDSVAQVSKAKKTMISKLKDKAKKVIKD